MSPMISLALHRKDKKIARWLLRGGVAALAALAAHVNFEAQQRKWIFQTDGSRGDPSSTLSAGLSDRWIVFDSEESGAQVTLHGLWLAQSQVDAPVLLYLHGARWDLSGSVQRMQHLHD